MKVKTLADCNDILFMNYIWLLMLNDPERYGVVEFDSRIKKVISIEEKPTKAKIKLCCSRSHYT